jgi:hypothetical protein
MAFSEMGIEAIAKGLDSFEKNMDQMKRSIGDVGNYAAGATSPLDQLSTAFDVVAIGAISAAAAVGSMLVGALTKAVFEAADAEKIWTKLGAALYATNDAMANGTLMTVEMAKALAMQFRDLAGGSDEAIASIIDMAVRMGNISANELPDFIQKTLDLAAATGLDATAAARLLAQVYEDPISALGRLRKLGIQFTEAEEKQVKALIAAGKSAEANEIIMKRLGTATAGQAAAAAATFSGQLAILKNHILEVFEEIGNKLLPVLTPLISKFIDLAENAGAKLIEMFDKYLLPVLQNVFAIFMKFLTGDWKGAFKDIIPQETIDKILNLKDRAMDFVDEFITPFVTKHGPTMEKAIIAIGIAFAGWKIVNAIGTLTSLIATMTPLGLILAAVGAAVAIFAVVWDNDWMGIRTTLTEVWENSLRPALEQLIAWLGENLPQAIQYVAGFWSAVLAPAIEYVSGLFQSASDQAGGLAGIYNTYLAPAIQYLADLWTSVLQPAMATFIDWAMNYALPFWQALGNVLGAVIGVAIESLVGWFYLLSPLMEGWLNNVVIPIANFIIDVLTPALYVLTNILIGKLVTAFESLKVVIKWVTDRLNELADAINDLKLPAWLQPGSPTPFEMGLRGIAKALKTVDKEWNTSISMMGAGSVSAPPTVGPVQSTRSQTTNNEKNILEGATINNNTGFDLGAFAETVRNA